MPDNPRRAVRWAECLYAVVVGTLGILWALPNDAFSLAINYRAMSSLAPEWAWALLFLVWAIAWMLAIWRGPLVFRRAGATFGGALLIFVGASWFISNPLTINGWVVFWSGIGALLARYDLR